MPTPKTCLQALDILVLAGGLGTRIRPALGDVPKIMAPIAGRPYLAYLFEWFERFGARRIVLALGHGARAVLDYLDRQPSDRIEIVPSVERLPLGTAGAIRFARRVLRSDPVLVLNGDSFSDADLCAFLDRHRRAGTIGTVLCTETDDAGRYGRVELDQNGLICRFVEKDPSFHGRALINAGAYLLSAALLDAIASGSGVSIERDVFERLPPLSLAAFAGRFRFVDIGTPEALGGAAEVVGASARGAWSRSL